LAWGGLDLVMMMKAVYYEFGKKQENCTHFSEVISGEG
jgi:hypothetical protein